MNELLWSSDIMTLTRENLSSWRKILIQLYIDYQLDTLIIIYS